MIYRRRVTGHSVERRGLYPVRRDLHEIRQPGDGLVHRVNDLRGYDQRVP